MGQDDFFQPNEKIYKLDVAATMQTPNDYIIYTSYEVCKKNKNKLLMNNDIILGTLNRLVMKI